MVSGCAFGPRFVNGLTRFVQHPRRDQIYPIHLGWAVFTLTAIVHFWWYEIGLSTIRTWTFVLYFFVLVYAMLFVAIASLLLRTLHLPGRRVPDPAITAGRLFDLPR